MKTALITGLPGQDATLLSEFLLEKDYKVIGTHRYSSTEDLHRLNNISEGVDLEYLDITDSGRVNQLVHKYKPDEIYNLAAISHVGYSFDHPKTVFETNTLPVIYFLQAIKELSPKTKFYQASTSEMYGSNYSIDLQKDPIKDEDGYVRHEDLFHKFQDEDTPLMSRSPYATSKIAAHHSVVNFREAYGLFACSGILFNHETLIYGTPLIIKNKFGLIDIQPIGDIARFRTGLIFDMDKDYQSGNPIHDLWVWDNDKWSKVTHVSGYPHKEQKNPRIINSRRSVYAATGNHICMMNDGGEKKTSDLKIGDKVQLVNLPKNSIAQNISLEEAEWLGMLVGDGNLNNNIPRFTNKDQSLKERFAKLWLSFVEEGRFVYKDSYSSFTGEKIGQLECYGKYKNKNDIDIYTDDISPFGHKNKKVPSCILNSTKDVMEAFLIGYNNCDGLKKNPCKYRFKNFKTNSHTLAAGLVFLIYQVTQQKYNITIEESWKYGKQQFYYSINLLSDKKSAVEKYKTVNELLNQGLSQRAIYRNTGISRNFIRKVFNGYEPNNTHHLEKTQNEIKKIIEIPNYNGWFFDLETESGTFQAGVGQGLVHNSPLRGEKFVTRKITKWIGEYKKWINNCQDLEEWRTTEKEIVCSIYGDPTYDNWFPKLALGNLEAKRDWSHAKDFVRGMWMMLQHDRADDYVLASGETHSIKDFLKLAFQYSGLDLAAYWEKVVYIDPKFYRPTEVELLLGHADKARDVLGWKPEYSFKDLVKEMVENDIRQQSR